MKSGGCLDPREPKAKPSCKLLASVTHSRPKRSSSTSAGLEGPAEPHGSESEERRLHLGFCEHLFCSEHEPERRVGNSPIGRTHTRQARSRTDPSMLSAPGEPRPAPTFSQTTSENTLWRGCGGRKAGRGGRRAQVCAPAGLRRRWRNWEEAARPPEVRLETRGV